MLKKIIGKLWRMSPTVFRNIIVRATQKKFTVSVGAIVTNGEGRILLLDHVLRPASGWGIPGGFINSGEQPAEALKRELGEEIGLEIEGIELFQVKTVNRHVEILFRARARACGAVKSLEINKIQWFCPDELPPEMNKSQKRFIERVLSEKQVGV